MTKLFAMLLDWIAPPLVMFTLTEHEDKVTLVIKEAQVNQETRSQIMTPAKPDMEEAGEMDATLERIEIFSSSSNLKIPRAKVGYDRVM